MLNLSLKQSSRNCTANESRSFCNTWGWVVLHNKQEARHKEVNLFYRDFRLREGIAYTTDYILDEVLTLLFRRLPFSLARESIRLIDSAFDHGYLKLERISPERFEEAKKLRMRLQDKPGISFTDLTSMVVMQELNISSVLTEDSHFIHVGMGFHKLP